MKALPRARRFRPKAILPVCIAASLVTGCSHTLRFQAVDATTRQSLPGVSTTWHEHAYNLLTGSSHETGPTNLPPSAADGIIVISNVHKEWANRIVFSKADYHTVY